MKVCTICNRTYPDGQTVCESDGQRLTRVRRDADTAAAPTVDWEGPMVGDIVGNFRLRTMLAEGGMGRVFSAQHVSLNRSVAIKFLLPEHCVRADLVQRFFNEARSVNAIKHPHIIEIYDFVEDLDADGHARVYMVMELLAGEDSRKRMRRTGPYAPDTLIHVATQVAETLAAAHEQGILHRDLKPDNIFLCDRDGDDAYVKLLDFGAAKGFGARPGHHLTRPGVAIGTPEYMSPEQIAGQALDGRTDAYGLGCVCYELLSGSVPFSTSNVAMMLAQHTSEQPEPISSRRATPPEISHELEAVVMRCMQKRPDDRYPDLWAVAEALRACRTGGAAALPAASGSGQRPLPDTAPDLAPDPELERQAELSEDDPTIETPWHERDVDSGPKLRPDADGDPEYDEDRMLAPARPDRPRRWPWVLAGAVLLGVAAALVLALAR